MKTNYQLAVRDPGAVAWYCALKLEMATALTAALLTEQWQSDDVPGRGDAQQKIEAQLRSRMGLDISVTDIPELRHSGQVDDSYTTFGWSEGGTIHAHMAVWTVLPAPARSKRLVSKPDGRAGWRSTRHCLVKMLCHRPRLRTAWLHSGTARTPNTASPKP